MLIHPGQKDLRCIMCFTSEKKVLPFLLLKLPPPSSISLSRPSTHIEVFRDEVEEGGGRRPNSAQTPNRRWQKSTVPEGRWSIQIRTDHLAAGEASVRQAKRGRTN